MYNYARLLNKTENQSMHNSLKYKSTSVLLSKAVIKQKHPVQFSEMN